MSDTSDEEPQEKRKKGVVHAQRYKRNIIRGARVKGLPYVSHKGKVVAGKTCPTNLTCKCPKKCYSTLTNDSVTKIWDYFYSLESKNQQDTYLQTLTEAKEVGKRTVKNNAIVRPRDDNIFSEDEDNMPDGNEVVFKRNHTFSYNLKIDGTLFPVCKNVFLSVHGITAERMKRICKLLLANKSPRDLRGLNRSGNAVPGHVCVLIHNHINSYEFHETHYGGKPKKYLDARLDIKQMHSMFVEKHPELTGVVNYKYYYMYFKENFELSFGRLQVDVCCSCESFKSKMRDPLLSENAKRNVAAEMIIHKRRAKKFYTAMTSATEDKDPEMCAISFDYMQNLPLPHIPVQEVFYMRQLWLNTFCVHNLKTNDAKLYVYHEGIANKSPDEVCSLLFEYIKTEIPDTIKRLVLFSDGPYGQNKNHTVIRFLMNLCDNSNFETITYYFPSRGHSFSPCDRDFGCIKRLVRKVDRIYTPQEYAELMLRASKRGRFSVREVKSEDILDFKNWWGPHYKKTTASDETSGRGVRKEDKDILKISTYKQFDFSSSTPGKVVVKQFINGLTSSTLTLKKFEKAPELPVQMAYPQGKVPINKNKMEDIRKLTEYTAGYKDFYDSILQWPTTDNNTPEDPTGDAN